MSKGETLKIPKPNDQKPHLFLSTGWGRLEQLTHTSTNSFIDPVKGKSSTPGLENSQLGITFS